MLNKEQLNQSVQEEQMEKENEKSSSTPIEKKPIKKNQKKGKVISVTPYYIIVQDKIGNGIRKNGSFPDVKVGDYIFI